mgnify:CR=1 FL=1
MINVTLAGTDKIILDLDKMIAPRGAISTAQITMVAKMAVIGRDVMEKQFTNKTGPDSLFYNNPLERARRRKDGEIKGPLLRNRAGYYDRRGPQYRLIHFSLKGKGSTKSAHLSSYPMNLWERRRAGGGSRWIMTVKLQPVVAARAKEVEGPVQEWLEREAQRILA